MKRIACCSSFFHRSWMIDRSSRTIPLRDARQLRSAITFPAAPFTAQTRLCDRDTCTWTTCLQLLREANPRPLDRESHARSDVYKLIQLLGLLAVLVSTLMDSRPTITVHSAIRIWQSFSVRVYQLSGTNCLPQFLKRTVFPVFAADSRRASVHCRVRWELVG